VRTPGTDYEFELRLPKREYSEPRNEADYYGAASLIAEKHGLNPLQPPMPRAAWTHFPIPDWMKPQVPYDLYGHRTFAVPKALRPVLIPNLSSEIFMRQYGYRSAFAVGAPFAYALGYSRRRITGSRLVMPEHTLSYIRYSEHSSVTVQKLIRFILNTRDAYSLTVFCLHPDDVRKGLWPKELNKAGIPWVAGAERFDLNALRRMVALMSQFEEVLTNNLGSHIVYGWQLGCNVRFATIGTMHDAASLSGTDLIKNHPLGAKALDVKLSALSSQELDVIGKKYGMVGPALSPEIYAQLASEALGLASLKTNEEMVDLLGWRKISRTWLISKVCTHDRLARAIVRKVRIKLNERTHPKTPS